MIRPLALLLMLPLVTLSVTFCPPAVPARMLPLIARLTLAVALKELTVTLPLFVTALSTVRSVAWLMTRSLPAPVTLAERILNVAFVGSKAPSDVQSSPLDVMAPVPVIEPPGTFSVTLALPLPAVIAPILARLPDSTEIAMSPEAVTLAGSIARPLVSLTVSPPLVILAVRLLTLLLSAVLFCAVTLRTLPTIWLEEVLRVIPPWLALRVTLPVPAMMLPEPMRLPVAKLMEMSPLLVATLVPTASRVFCSLTVRV